MLAVNSFQSNLNAFINDEQQKEMIRKIVMKETVLSDYDGLNKKIESIQERI